MKNLVIIAYLTLGVAVGAAACSRECTSDIGCGYPLTVKLEPPIPIEEASAGAELQLDIAFEGRVIRCTVSKANGAVCDDGASVVKLDSTSTEATEIAIANVTPTRLDVRVTRAGTPVRDGGFAPSYRQESLDDGCLTCTRSDDLAL